MKKIMKLFVYVAAAAMTLASCQKNEIDNQVPQEYEYTFLIGNADTKAVIGNESVVWEDGDQMGVYTKVASGTISENAYGDITPGSPATMKMYSDQALAIGDYVYAYYPYNSDNEDRNLMVTLSIPSVQDGKDDMPMVAIPYCVESAIGSGQQDAPAGKIKFANLGSVIEFHVYSTTEAYKTEIVKSVTFNAEQAIAGDFTFDLTAVDYSKEETLAISGYKATTVVSTLSTSTQVSADKNAATVVKMVVAPGSYTGNVVVTTDKAIYTYPISTAKAFKRSGVQPFGLNLRENVRQENTSSEPVEITATLTFDDKSKRTEYSTLKQVWTENGIILTNEKSGATTNVGDYCEPARFYKGSKIYVEAPGNIVNIVFNCNSGEYATALNNSITNSSKSGNDVTLTLDGNSSKSPEYQMSAKVFVNSVTVTYMSVEGGETPEQPTTPVLTVDPSEIEVEAVGGDKEVTYTVTNSVDEGVVTATTDVDWISNFEYTVANKVTFSVKENTTAIARTATITLAYTGAESKTVTVKQAAASQGGGSEGGETTETWTLVTDASTLAIGDKIVIVASDSDYAMGADKGNNRNAASITKTGNTVVINDDVQIITLEDGIVSNTFAFNTGSGYLYAASSGSNHLKTKTTLDENGSWSITITSDGVATVTANGNYTRNLMRFNPNNGGSPLFACYASDSTTGVLVSIYKLVGGSSEGGESPSEPEPEPQEPYIRVSQEVFNVPATQTSVTFNVDANVGWGVEHTEGVTEVNIIEVSEDELVMTVEVAFPANETAEPKTHTVTFIPEELDETVTVTINQAAKVEVDDSFEAGKYWIVANGKYAMPVTSTSNYDYLKVDDAGYKDNVFTFKKVENGYTIQQSDNKYLYMKETYNNFNVSATAPTQGHIWTIAQNEDGSYKILNVLMSKYIQLDSQYGTYGSYDAVKGTMPNLVPADDAKDRPVFSVTSTSKSVACDVTEASFEIVSNQNWTVVAGEGVSVNVTSGSGNGTVTMTFAENKSEESVDYTATVKAEGLEDIVLTVTQSGVPQEGGDKHVEYTLLFGADYNSKNISSYTDTWTATNNNFACTLTNWNNNNNDWNYVKAGRKNTASVATITTTNVVEAALKTVTMTVDAVTTSKINSLKLYVSTDSNFSSKVEYTATAAKGDVVFSITDPIPNAYYKIEVNCASGSSNGLITVSKVVYKN